MSFCTIWEFRRLFRGRYWLEVFLLSGVTTVESRVQALRDCIEAISPDKIQVNTVARPPAEGYAMPVPCDQLARIAAQLHPQAEVIVPYSYLDDKDSSGAGCNEVLDLLRRRPCSIPDIAAGLGLHPHEAAKCVGRLVSEQKVRAQEHEGVLYYEATF